MGPPPEQGASEDPALRKPSKEATWLGPKESAVRQHRLEMKTKMKTNKVEEVKPARPKQVRKKLLDTAVVGVDSLWCSSCGHLERVFIRGSCKGL